MADPDQFAHVRKLWADPEYQRRCAELSGARAAEIADYNRRARRCRREQHRFMRELIRSGYRALAKEAHPDQVGGDASMFDALTGARAWLEHLVADRHMPTPFDRPPCIVEMFRAIPT